MTREHSAARPGGLAEGSVRDDDIRPAAPAVGSVVSGPGAETTAAPRIAQTRGDITRLLRRPDFLAASRAERWSTTGMVVQARPRAPGEKGGDAPRLGFTCSKKVGNAVARNRAKRRLRAAADMVLPGLARYGWDYVLIGRFETTAARDFTALQADLRESLDQLHAGRGRKSGPPRKGGKGKSGGHGRGKGA